MHKKRRFCVNELWTPAQIELNEPRCRFSAATYCYVWEVGKIMKLTLKRRFSICIEVLFIRSGHSHTAQEKQLSIFKNGYDAGVLDEKLGWTGTRETKYNALLMEVINKYDGETRHETALRHIRHGEAPSCNSLSSET
jgi:hypothetical protein